MTEFLEIALLTSIGKYGVKIPAKFTIYLLNEEKIPRMHQFYAVLVYKIYIAMNFYLKFLYETSFKLPKTLQ